MKSIFVVKIIINQHKHLVNMRTNNKMTELSEEELTDIFAGLWVLIYYMENGTRCLEWVKI